MTELRLTQLNIYPVKSMRQIAVTRSRLEAFGLQNDRRWMVIDEDHRMITQRQHARLCLVQPSLSGQAIQLSAAGYPDLMVSQPSDEAGKITVSIWNDHCQAYDAGDEAAHWLSEFLSLPCRLVYFPDDEFRQLDLNFARPGEKTAFSDGFPLLLISQASLDDLNQRLAPNEHGPLSMSRFRPNLVVAGCEPYAEDSWKKVRIGDMALRIVKPCSRCVIPNIDIETARIEKEPARTLASYRKRDNKVFFGQNVIAEQEGELTIDMPVEIIETV
ncbi:MAG: MOSC domain-containing protein [Thioalkalispiraceae bacterium]|jgi:hypothetical protein